MYQEARAGAEMAENNRRQRQMRERCQPPHFTATMGTAQLGRLRHQCELHYALTQGLTVSLEHWCGGCYLQLGSRLLSCSQGLLLSSKSCSSLHNQQPVSDAVRRQLVLQLKTMAI